MIASRISVLPGPLADALEAIQSEGVEAFKDRLLLWFIRNQYGVGAEDSYANVFSEPISLDDQSETMVDGAIVLEGRDLVTPIYIVYADDSGSLAGKVNSIDTLLSDEHFSETRLARRSARLRSVFEAALSSGATEISRTIVAVCPQTLAPAARTRLRSKFATLGAAVELYDLSFLSGIAAADSSAMARDRHIALSFDTGQMLKLQIGQSDGIVVPIRAIDIAEWPGVEDRSLFDLNVRHALGMNRVRRSLDGALSQDDSPEEFIAYHNGITAVCEHFELTPEGADTRGLSVVNGAQSVVAINANVGKIDPKIQLLLKLVEASPQSKLARNIAIRSNTQNPVTSRNLRALDPVQERLRAEVAEFGFLYLVRPDQDAPAGDKVIRNDDVAQLLCSIYSRKPALAVKKQVLFEAPQYQEVFSDRMNGARVVFAHSLRQVVESAKQEVPDLYSKAWSLTALTLVYMTAEAMRTDHASEEILDNPDPSVRNLAQLKAHVAPFVRAACRALRQRADEPRRAGIDDFKVEFKHTRVLMDLGESAAWAYKQERSGSDR